jgi:hypothetical protein
MYVLCLEFKDEVFYWQGKGYFTKNVTLAKTYPTWQNANGWCNRIKRWDLKFSDFDSELDEQNERLNLHK